MFTNPVVSDFKTTYYRDFPYTDDPQDLTKVQDRDITLAILKTTKGMNQALWSDQDEWNLAFLLLTAHHLCLGLRNSAQGIGSTMDWLHSNKAAGPVNEAFVIPERVQNSPQLAALCKTGYGGEYLTMLLPRLVGSMFTVTGRTKP